MGGSSCGHHCPCGGHFHSHCGHHDFRHGDCGVDIMVLVTIIVITMVVVVSVVVMVVGRVCIVELV
jgi:hypothetical protein